MGNYRLFSPALKFFARRQSAFRGHSVAAIVKRREISPVQISDVNILSIISTPEYGPMDCYC